jgi:hypothetical protein
MAISLSFGMQLLETSLPIIPYHQFYDTTTATPPPPIFPNFETDIMIRPPMFYQKPKPVILGMSLAVNRLVLYVQGYGEKVRAENKISSAFENG